MLLLFFAVFEIITAVHGFQFLDEFAVGNGFAEVIALDPFAASLLEEAELLGGFHAFGQVCTSRDWASMIMGLMIFLDLSLKFLMKPMSILISSKSKSRRVAREE